MGIFDVLGSLDFFYNFPQTIQIACLLVIIFHISYKQAIPTWYYSLEKLTFLVSSSLISISGKQGDNNYTFLHSQEATETFAKKIDVHLAPVGQDDWKSRRSRELQLQKYNLGHGKTVSGLWKSQQKLFQGEIPFQTIISVKMHTPIVIMDI